LRRAQHFVPLWVPQIDESIPFAQNGADARAEIRNRIKELPIV
jgi:hypothetical protein